MEPFAVPFAGVRTPRWQLAGRSLGFRRLQSDAAPGKQAVAVAPDSISEIGKGPF